MEIVEDRDQSISILMTSQLPLANWNGIILDRIVHNAHRLKLDGPSMRKLNAGGDGGTLVVAADLVAGRSSTFTEQR